MSVHSCLIIANCFIPLLLHRSPPCSSGSGVESVLTKAKSQTKAVEESTNNNGAAKEKVTTFDNGVTTEEVTVPAQGRAVVDLATLALTGAARALSSECKLYVVEVKDKTGTPCTVITKA